MNARNSATAVVALLTLGCAFGQPNTSAEVQSSDPKPNSIIEREDHMLTNGGEFQSHGSGYEVPVHAGHSYRITVEFSNINQQFPRWVLIYKRLPGIPEQRCDDELCWEEVESFWTEGGSLSETYPASTSQPLLVATWQAGIDGNERWGATHDPVNKQASGPGAALVFQGPNPGGASARSVVRVVRQK
jgi:hypothetical protein